MIKFKVSPSVKAAAVPTGAGFAGFAGMKKRCVAFEKRGDVRRCKKFKKGAGSPVCDARLVDGGRSPGLVRAGVCPGSARSGSDRYYMDRGRKAMNGMRRRKSRR